MMMNDDDDDDDDDVDEDDDDDDDVDEDDDDENDELIKIIFDEMFVKKHNTFSLTRIEIVHLFDGVSDK